MNSKAIKRQLLAAIAMVLVAALALGSSTYAWFVASGSVTATGMSVNVQSTGGLLIKYNGTSDAWGQTATANMGTKLLLPASTADMKVWSTATAAAPGSHEMNNATIAPVSVADTTPSITDNNYLVKQTFLIRSTGNTDGGTKGLYVQDVVVSAAQELNMSLRLGIVARYKGAEKARFIMAPITVGQATPTNNYTVYTAQEIDGQPGKYTPQAVATPVSITAKGTSAAILDSSTPVPGNSDTDYVEVSIYIWYEGEDEHLYSDNVRANEKLDISIVFSSNSTSSTSTTTNTPNLSGATAVEENKVEIESTSYFPIPGMFLNGKQLYAGAAGAISKTSTIYTITGDVATDVTSSCTLPS